MTVSNKYSCEKPIILFRGDDTDFPGNQEITISIDYKGDKQKTSAVFNILGITRTFDTIPEDGILHISFSREDTLKFPYGPIKASLYLEYHTDNNGVLRRTVSTKIPFVITNDPHLAYCGSKGCYLCIGKTTTWDSIEGKPTTISGYGITDAATRAALDAEIVSRNAADVALHSDMRLSESRLARAQSDIISAMVALKNSRPTFGAEKSSATSEASRPYIVMPGTNRYGEHVAVAVRGGMLI